MPRIANILILCAGLLMCALGLHAATDDHLSSYPAQVLFQASGFAHGYIHGYEEGFHFGDLDLQFGHPPRPLGEFSEYRAGKSGYKSDFGDKNSFQMGYRGGFAAGYADALEARSFRGIGQTHAAARDLPSSMSKRERKAFDSGFGNGYALGVLYGAAASQQDEDFDATTTLCAPGSSESAAHPPPYCDAFVRGYTMGYPDGYLEQGVKRNLTTQARK